MATALYIVMALEPIETAVVAPLLSFRVHLVFNLCLAIQVNLAWVRLEIRQSKINSRWVAGPIGQTNRRPSV